MRLTGGTENAEPRASAWRWRLGTSIRHMRRNAQVYLRACVGFAPDLELSAQLLCAFSHPDETKVPRPPARLQHRRADASSIVAHSDVQGGIAIDYLDLDVLRTRVPERIAERFASDQEGLLPRDGVELSRNALDARLEFGRLMSRHLLPLCSDSLGEIGDATPGRPQFLQSVPAFLQKLVRSVERLLHQLARRLVRRNMVGRRLKSPDQPLHSL